MNQYHLKFDLNQFSVPVEILKNGKIIKHSLLKNLDKFISECIEKNHVSLHNTEGGEQKLFVTKNDDYKIIK